MKIRPLADKVLVQRLEAETKTAGGIVLPDSAKEKPQSGTIDSAGAGKLQATGRRRSWGVPTGVVARHNFGSGVSHV